MRKGANGQSAVGKVQEPELNKLGYLRIRSAVHFTLHGGSSIVLPCFVSLLVSAGLTVAVTGAVSMYMTVADVGSVRVDDTVAIRRRQLQFFFEPCHDGVKPNPIAQVREKKWPAASHLARVAIHHLE